MFIKYKIMIYILKLENNKYYVGVTSNLDKRLTDHMHGKGSEWTKKYKMKSLYKLIHDYNAFDEDRYTKEYMNKFGIDNVRGGSYSNFYLTPEQKKLLIKELRTANDECFKCGRNTHYSNKCYAKTDVNGEPIKSYKKPKDIKKEYKKDQNKYTKYLIEESKKECIEDMDKIIISSKYLFGENILNDIKTDVKENKHHTENTSGEAKYMEETEIINNFYKDSDTTKCTLAISNNNEKTLLIHKRKEENIDVKKTAKAVIGGVLSVYNWFTGKK
jgi:predicted GIY-YIG superfamily endonuclease